MSRKNKDVFSEFIVGVFMVAVLALLVYFTIVISGVDILTGRAKTTATISFEKVGGLKERDNVVYRGMKVGTVESITLGGTNIVVTVKVDRDVVLRESAYITVASTSLLGGNFLMMEEGKGEVMPLESTVFKGTPPADWMRDLGEIARKLKNATDGNSLQNIISNAESVNEIVARVGRGEGTAGKFLSKDDTVYDDVKSAVADAKQALSNAQKTFDKTAEISDRLAKGEGTLGKLTSESAMYDELSALIKDVRQIVDNYRDTTPITTFGSLATGAL